MRTVIVAAILLIGTTPAFARHHHHYRHGVHRYLTERHHHDEAKHKTNLDSSTQRDVEDPAARRDHANATDIDPEALAWSTPKEDFPDRPRKLVGKLVVADKTFPFVSGGSGWSIPWGHWPVTPGDVGDWGARHGAIGLNHGDDIPDPRLHRGRDGVEIHAAEGNHTAGCVGIREGYKELKGMVLGMIEKFGHAWLHVTPHAVAITPSRYLAGKVGQVEAAATNDDDEPQRKGRPHRRHHHTRMASR